MLTLTLMNQHGCIGTGKEGSDDSIAKVQIEDPMCCDL